MLPRRLSMRPRSTKMEMRIAAKTAQVPVRVIDRSFRDGKRNLALTGTLLARAVRERSKHPKSPPGSIPDVDIDAARGNLSENFAQPLDFDTFGSVALTASQAFHHAPAKVTGMTHASQFQSRRQRRRHRGPPHVPGRGDGRGRANRCDQSDRRAADALIYCRASSMPTSTSKARCSCRANSRGRRSCMARWRR